jgi:hypothetical protein
MILTAKALPEWNISRFADNSQRCVALAVTPPRRIV